MQNLERVQPKLREGNVKNVKGTERRRSGTNTMHSVNEIHNAHNRIHCILAYY